MRKRVFFAIILSLIVVLASQVSATPEHTSRKIKCGRDCQKSNDYYLHANDYRDYFVSDSDGSKDMIFSDFVYEPFPGVQCRIIKNDSSNKYSIAAGICKLPNGDYLTLTGSGPRGPKGEDG